MLREGAFADVLVFDLAKVNEAATYEQPHQLAEGFDTILVNGRVVRLRGTSPTRCPAACCASSASVRRRT